MTKVRVLGRRSAAETVLRELQRLGLVEIVDSRSTPAVDRLDGDRTRSARIEELTLLLSQTEQLTVGVPAVDGPAVDIPTDLDVAQVRGLLAVLVPRVEDVDRRLAALRDERLVLAGHLTPLRLLLPLVPVLAGLDVDRLEAIGLATVAVVLNTDDERLVDVLRAELAEQLDARFELASTRVEKGAIGCLVVFRTDDKETVRSILGQAAVRSVALPGRFQGLALRATVDAMQRRLDDIPAETSGVDAERRALLQPHAQRLVAFRDLLNAEIELLSATRFLTATERAFLAECWVPRPRLPQLRRELVSRLGPSVVVEDAATSPYDAHAPVLLRNTRLSRPFEPLVRFLELPRAGSVDPTMLMAIVLPLMFGAMVGDIGYGLALLVLATVASRKLGSRAARMPEVRGLLRLLLLGAGWSVVFGVLYGEFFGDLGQRLVGDFAVWRYRPGPDALEPLLIFSVVVGAAHVVLGLLLGAWQAAHFREPRVLLDKLGTLLALAGLFGLAAAAVDHLPAGALTPSAAVMIVGVVLVMSLHGLLGVLTGALDLLGRLGNILSYLRLAAVGLASAHLAGVANELGSVGPIWMGILVATFFHALNLALASFSPIIQSLRLHYVEFFGVFFVGGGRAFRPFGHQPERALRSTTEEQSWKLA